MERRSMIILTIGIVAIAISASVFAMLLMSSDHKVTFLMDHDDLAYGFVIVDEDTGETHPLERGADIYDRTTIRCVSDDFQWIGGININGNMIECGCHINGKDCMVVLWTNGARVTDADMIDGQLNIHLTEMRYCLAISLSLSKIIPKE